LGAASVIGRDFDLALLARTLEQEPDRVLDLIEPAAVRGLVLDVGPGRFTFQHALIEHALYDAVSPTRRARMHRAVGEAIEASCGTDLRSRASELVRHWTNAATPEGRVKATTYAELAGDDAIDRLAPLEAVRWYSLALELLTATPDGDDSRRARLLVGLGTAQRQAGDTASRRSLLDAAQFAERIGDVGSLVRAALANSRGWNSVYGGVDEEKVAMLRSALAHLADDRSILRANLLAILCNETYYGSPLDDRLALAEEAVAIARRAGSPAELTEVLLRTFETISMPQTLELRLRWTTEALELLAAHEGFWPRAPAVYYIAPSLAALESGDGATLRRAQSGWAALDDRMPATMYNQAFHAVWKAALDGDVPLAERLADEALALGDAAGFSDAFTVYGAQLVSVRWMQGRLPELADATADFVASHPGLDVFRAVDCWVSAHAGRVDRAREILDRELRDGFPSYADQHWLTGQTLWAHAAAIVGHREAAAVMRERLAPWHRQISTTHITFGGAIAQWLGVLDHAMGELDSADSWFAEALEVHERLLAPPLVAWTQATWANLLFDRDRGDDRARAQALRDDALAAARGRDWGLVERTVAAS
jgi:hypothetical protein